MDLGLIKQVVIEAMGMGPREEVLAVSFEDSK